MDVVCEEKKTSCFLNDHLEVFLADLRVDGDQIEGVEVLLSLFGD